MATAWILFTFSTCNATTCRGFSSDMLPPGVWGFTPRPAAASNAAISPRRSDRRPPGLRATGECPRGAGGESHGPCPRRGSSCRPPPWRLLGLPRRSPAPWSSEPTRHHAVDHLVIENPWAPRAGEPLSLEPLAQHIRAHPNSLRLLTQAPPRLGGGHDGSHDVVDFFAVDAQVLSLPRPLRQLPRFAQSTSERIRADPMPLRGLVESLGRAPPRHGLIDVERVDVAEVVRGPLRPAARAVHLHARPPEDPTQRSPREPGAPHRRFDVLLALRWPCSDPDLLRAEGDPRLRSLEDARQF